MKSVDGKNHEHHSACCGYLPFPPESHPLARRLQRCPATWQLIGEPRNPIKRTPMIEVKLLVGRYLEFTPTPKRGLTGNPPVMVNVTAQIFKFRNRTDAIRARLTTPSAMSEAFGKATWLWARTPPRSTGISSGFRGTKAIFPPPASPATCSPGRYRVHAGFLPGRYREPHGGPCRDRQCE